MSRLALSLLTASLAAAVAAPHAVAQSVPTLAPLPKGLPRTHKPQPTAGPITPADLMTRLYIFADDSMMGRNTGTAGNVKGTNYLAAEAKKIGLLPGGENGTYFQTLPLTERSISPNTKVSAGGTTFKLGTDYIIFGPDTAKLTNTPIVWGGRIGDAETIQSAQATGKVVVYGPPRDTSVQAARAFFPRVDGAAAIVMLTLDKLPASAARMALEPTVDYTPPNAQQRPRYRALTPVAYMRPSAVSAMFAGDMNALAIGASGKTMSIDFMIVTQPAKYPARNVVAILPGSDPVLKNQYVAIGAHNDHVGMTSGDRALDHDSIRVYNHYKLPMGADSRSRSEATPEEVAAINADIFKMRQGETPKRDSIFNGADDDGSGSVGVLEIAQYLASLKTKPKRSILFVWHTGEEKGLWGSEYFTDNPTVPRDSIVTQLNIDMIGRGDASDIVGGGPGYLQLIGSRRLSTQLGDIVEAVNKDEKHDMTLDYALDANGHPQQIYCRSDHYSYARYGIPVTFFTTGVHPDYHQLTDEPQYIDYDHLARVTKFIAGITLRVANLDQAPVVDKPKPNPQDRCVQ